MNYLAPINEKEMRLPIKLFLGFFVFLNSCGKEYYDTFNVENSTNKQLIIEGFAVKWSEETNRNSIYKEVIEIQPNSQYSIRKGIGESSEPKGIFESPQIIDSVNIIFNNQKIVRYCCYEENHFCFDKKNILNFQEYYEKLCGKHECTYTYMITELDFEASEIIN